VKRLAVAALLAVAACGGGQPSGDANKILRESGTAMAQVQTVNATLKVTKGTISVQKFALINATTAVRMPADSDSTYRVKEQDITFSFQVVITGGKLYVHIPLTEGFQPAPAAEAAQFPDMARLFDPATGLPALIPAGTNKKWIASEQLDGRTVDHVAATYSPEQVRALLPQLNSSGPVHADLWIGSDHLIRTALLDGDFGDGGKEAAVEVDIANFNTPVIITSPTP
jgi:hypothetical protein